LNQDCCVTTSSLVAIDRIIAGIQPLVQQRTCVSVAIDGRGGAGKSTLAGQ
jgi:hypothetical protein